MTDEQLLERFASRQEAAAFEELVRRHGPMVLRTCQRVLRHAQDAEDAFQGTFMVLSRKAGAFAKERGSVGSWLYGMAYRVSLQTREKAQKCRVSFGVNDRTLADDRQPPRSMESDLRQVLDEELSRLPQKCRSALVLCYLEGKSNEEAALQLHCPEGTIKSRLAQGRDSLRARLARRGLAVSSVALGALLTQSTASAAVPAGLASSTVQGAALLAAGKGAGGAVSLPAAGMANAALKGIFWAKVKLYGLTAAAVATVAVAASAPLLVPEQKPPAATVAVNPVQLGVNASLGGRRPFLDDNLWNQDISRESLDPASAQFIQSMGLDRSLFPSFSTTGGYTYIVVPGNQAKVPIQFDFPQVSDPGPYPIPPDAPWLAGRYGRDDSPLLVLDRDHWKIYELGRPRREGAGWRGGGGAVFDLGSNQLRPLGWTSAIVSGMPLFPGFVRHDEVFEQRAILHALCFGCRPVRKAFVAPARNAPFAARNDPSLPVLGMRVRLRADYNISGFPPDIQVILRALKKYGMFLGDTGGSGSDWYLKGTRDPRWNDKELMTLTRIKGKDFEVVRMGELQFPK